MNSARPINPQESVSNLLPIEGVQHTNFSLVSKVTAPIFYLLSLIADLLLLPFKLCDIFSFSSSFENKSENLNSRPLSNNENHPQEINLEQSPSNQNSPSLTIPSLSDLRSPNPFIYNPVPQIESSSNQSSPEFTRALNLPFSSSSTNFFPSSSFESPAPKANLRKKIEILTKDQIEARNRREYLGEDKTKIATKLQNQFQACKEQEKNEVDKFFFRYSPLEEGKTLSINPSPYSSVIGAEVPAQSGSEELSGKNVGFAHFIGKRPSMEDEHVAFEISLILSDGSIHKATVFGIFDGHGGENAAKFAANGNFKTILEQQLAIYNKSDLADENIWNALKQTFVKLHESFLEEASLKDDNSGSTCLVSLILNDKLWTACVGDSRAILSCGLQLSEDAHCIDKKYSTSIYKRAGFIAHNRIFGNLACARSIGDRQFGHVINPRPKITCVPLEDHKGKKLILSCDGVYEASSTRQIAKAAQENKNIPNDQLALNLVNSAFISGSRDNLSVLIVDL
jgi:serine/threonine protein phosphatase PrpC